MATANNGIKTLKVADITYQADLIEKALNGFTAFFADPKPTPQTIKGIVFDNDPVDPTTIKLILPQELVKDVDNRKKLIFTYRALGTFIKTAFVTYLLSIDGTDYSYLVPCIKCIYKKSDEENELVVEYEAPINNELDVKKLLERLLYFSKKYNVVYSVSSSNSVAGAITENNYNHLFQMTANGPQISNIFGLKIAKQGEANPEDIKSLLPWANATGTTYEEILKGMNTTTPEIIPNNINNQRVTQPQKSNKEKAINRFSKENIPSYVSELETPIPEGGYKSVPANAADFPKMAAIILGITNMNSIKNKEQLYDAFIKEYNRIDSLKDEEIQIEFGQTYTKETISTILGNAFEILAHSLPEPQPEPQPEPEPSDPSAKPGFVEIPPIKINTSANQSTNPVLNNNAIQRYINSDELPNLSQSSKRFFKKQNEANEAERRAERSKGGRTTRKNRKPAKGKSYKLRRRR